MSEVPADLTVHGDLHEKLNFHTVLEIYNKSAFHVGLWSLEADHLIHYSFPRPMSSLSALGSHVVKLPLPTSREALCHWSSNFLYLTQHDHICRDLSVSFIVRSCLSFTGFWGLSTCFLGPTNPMSWNISNDIARPFQYHGIDS